jgi:hypothetical protein
MGASEIFCLSEISRWYTTIEKLVVIDWDLIQKLTVIYSVTNNEKRSIFKQVLTAAVCFCKQSHKVQVYLHGFSFIKLVFHFCQLYKHNP